MTRRTVRAISVGAVLIATAACGPKVKYVPPTPGAQAPAYKENADWKTAQPSDAALRGDWWEIFGDPTLDALERQVAVTNQNLKIVQAQFAQAQAVVRANRSGLFPQVTSNPSASRLSESGTKAKSSIRGNYTDLMLPANVSYEADVWGRVRGIIETSRDVAQATAADLELVRLSVTSELAVDYFLLQGLDSQKQLLDAAVTAYGRALELTQNRFRGGVASAADVAFAETQLQTTRAQAVDVGVQRAQLEHAIAVLVGRPASSFSIAFAALDLQAPQIPVGLPADLLERRPDIAGAERRVAAANAQVGVAQAAFYPLLALTGVGGYESASLARWLDPLSNFWTVAPLALINLFDAGRRRAVSDQMRAAFEQASAVYQQTVLIAFREVEDNLATLRVLDEEAQIQAEAVAAAERSLTLATNRYRGGIATYLEVISAQSAALANQRTAATILSRRLTASVLLIKALGGGWNVSSLPQVSAPAAARPTVR